MDPKLLRLTVHIDGGARGNPGPAGAGVVIRSADDGKLLHRAGLFLGRTTNNVAEYSGMLAGLEAAARLGAAEVEVVSDSQLMIRQMTGEYRVRNERLKRLHRKACRLAGKFQACTFRHVPRKDNTQADRLVNRAIDLEQNVADAAD